MIGNHGPLQTASPIMDEEVVNELRELIANDPKLEPLREIFEPSPPPEGVKEQRVSFARLYQAIRGQLDDFDEQLDNDVPNSLKPFVHELGHALDDKNKDHQSVLEKIVENISARFAQRPHAPKIPLPPSPMFHDFAKDLVSKAIEFPDVKESDGKAMKFVPSLHFQNWGLTVQNTPSYTFIARTEVGLQNLVKWAAGQKKKVRVAGYRHTWSDFYSAHDEVLVMLLPLELLITLPSYNPTMQEIQKHSDLVGIEVPPVSAGDKSTSMLCTIKAGTTNDMFRNWCLQNRRWSLPFNVIMVEITFGGSNGPICHGSGFGSTTLSDLVEEFHYIDPAGNPKSITDREQLRAASGCFGLLGICTAVTLRLDAMAVAVMNPVKLPLPLAIPPPPGFPVPAAISMEGITPAMLEEARKNFIKRCEEDYYLEWFWFPLTDKVWVNTWKKEPADQKTLDKLKPYPSHTDAIAQWLQEWAAQTFINTEIFKLMSPKTQTCVISWFALKAMPDLPKPKDAIRTLVSEALHFRRGIQNMRCRDSEWEIPIPEAPNSPGKRDYEKIQLAWWDAIKLFYDREKEAPMRLTLEMRLTGGSGVTLAPQRGNGLGTISIEALTTTVTPFELWHSFMQQLVDKWAGYQDSKGNFLNTRPHWAKEWSGLTVRGQPIETYLKESAYKDAIPEFAKALEAIAKAQGTTVSEMRAMFGNPLLERLIFAP